MLLCPSVPVSYTHLDVYKRQGFFHIPDDFAYGRNRDAPGQRVFDAEHRRGNGGLHLAALEGKVAVKHFTVHKFQPLAVTQGLCADDCTVFKGDILACLLYTSASQILIGSNQRIPN